MTKPIHISIGHEMIDDRSRWVRRWRLINDTSETVVRTIVFAMTKVIGGRRNQDAVAGRLGGDVIDKILR